MLKTIQLNSCPNPQCQKKFEKSIIVRDNSKMPPDMYYACPYCLLKLESIPTQVLEKDEIFLEESPESNWGHLENEVPAGCPHYFGYLFDHYKDAIISKECLTCPRMTDCTLKKAC